MKKLDKLIELLSESCAGGILIAAGIVLGKAGLGLVYDAWRIPTQ